MTPVPANPKIYHITHVDNLPAIIAAGELRSDALVAAAGGPASMIGMSEIKRRRLEELEVKSLADVMVGQCVPFYFCPRSVMLYIIRQANHPELTYRGGQGPIVHLEAELREVLAWAQSQERPWAFSLSNAGAYYTQFRSDAARLHEVNWEAVAAQDWRAADIKEAKQAEFLVLNTFPWSLVRQVGMRSHTVATRVQQALAGTVNPPRVTLQPAWYYP